jgi:hypothetical protein
MSRLVWFLAHEGEAWADGLFLVYWAATQWPRGIGNLTLMIEDATTFLQWIF